MNTKLKFNTILCWVEALKCWAAPLKSWAVGHVGRVGRQKQPSAQNEIPPFFYEKVLEMKIRHLARASDRYLFVSWDPVQKTNCYYIEDVISVKPGADPFIVKLHPVELGQLRSLTMAQMYFTAITYAFYLKPKLPETLLP